MPNQKEPWHQTVKRQSRLINLPIQQHSSSIDSEPSKFVVGISHLKMPLKYEHVDSKLSELITISYVKLPSKYEHVEGEPSELVGISHPKNLVKLPLEDEYVIYPKVRLPNIDLTPCLDQYC